MQSVKKLTILIAGLFVFSASVVWAQIPPVPDGWLHPGIDIKPHQLDVASSMVYTTHAGFVTFAGQSPNLEKGWMVQVESDLNRDNEPDIITRYTHLLAKPEALMYTDVHYRREVYTPEIFMSLGKLPYGNGPYVTRNQLIGVVSDSGSRGRYHIQYELATSRFASGLTAGLDANTFAPPFAPCLENPYVEACSDDPALPGVFFSLNRKKPDAVRAPAYLNPGFVTPAPGKDPQMVPVFKAPTPKLPEPGLPVRDFLGQPPPSLPKPTSPPVTPVFGNPECSGSGDNNATITLNIIPKEQSEAAGGSNAPPGMCEWYISVHATEPFSHFGVHGTIGGVGVEHSGGSANRLECPPEVAGNCPTGWIGGTGWAVEHGGVPEAQNCMPDGSTPGIGYWEGPGHCGFKYSGDGAFGIPLSLPQYVNCDGSSNFYMTSAGQGNFGCN